MKNILITGASSGIGAASARMLHAKGYKLGLMARSTDKLNALAAELGERCHVLTCDVTRYEEVQSSVQRFVDTFGQIDVLINNAGLGYFDTLVGGKIEEWHTMVDVNIKGVLNVLHTCLPHLVASTGHIINLGSLASHFVFPNSGVYSATKHAVFAISESIRTELAKKVRVTTISPGAVNTPFVEQTKNEALLAQFRPSFAAGMPVEWVAQQIINAIEVPDGVNVSEIIMRPFLPERK
jgi:NADP-dependent 3-hydroxy acid dehydrogenase YdfG